MTGYLAGQTMNEALEKARHLNKEGLGTLLAPHWPLHQYSDQISKETMELVTSMGHKMIRGGLSLDPRHFGLDEGWTAAMERLAPIVTRAEEYGYGVWLDSEDPDSVGATIDLYLGLRPRFPHLAVTVPARSPRALSDLGLIRQVRGRVRLVKGLPPMDGEQKLTDAEVSDRFRLLMEILFQESNFFAIATHDPDLLAAAESLMTKYPKMFEFQLYLGLHDEGARRLVYEGGHPTTLYLPFGEGASRHLDRLAMAGKGPNASSSSREPGDSKIPG